MHTIRHIWGLYLHRWSVCFFFIDHFKNIFSVFSFLLFWGGGGGSVAAIGYLMQIFFISLHFLYDKGLLLPSSMQSNQLLNDCQFCLFWTPFFSTSIRLQIVVSSLDLKPAAFWTCSCLQALHLEYCKNEVHAGRGEERKKVLSICICIDSSQVIVIVVFHLGCLSVYVIYFWSLCSVLSSIFMLEVALYNHFVIMTITMIMMVIIIKYFFIPFKGKSGCHIWIIII